MRRTLSKILFPVLLPSFTILIAMTVFLVEDGLAKFTAYCSNRTNFGITRAINVSSLEGVIFYKAIKLFNIIGFDLLFPDVLSPQQYISLKIILEEFSS